MYNGATYAPGDKTTSGSYYNSRVANTLTATGSISNGDYSYNICSKSWTLPTKIQADNISGTAYYSGSSYNPLLAGCYYDSSYNEQGYWAEWWLRTADNSSFFALVASTSTLSVHHSYVDERGYTIRCLAK